LYCFLFSQYGKGIGISFVDSISLTVCHPKRIHSPRVFRGLAKRGKTTKGWLYGVKLHLSINENGELLAFLLLPWNTPDLPVLPQITQGLVGKLLGDKGYISQEMFENLFFRGLQQITKLRDKMKNRLMPVIDKILLRKRGTIDSVIGQLKSICQIEHSRHRSPTNFVVNLLGGLVGYSLRLDKPSLHLEKSAIRLLTEYSIYSRARVKSIFSLYLSFF
jgi:hypothetical protein